MQRVNQTMSKECHEAMKDGSLRIGDESIKTGLIAFKDTDYKTYIKRFRSAQERRDFLAQWCVDNDDLRDDNPNLGYHETYIIIKES